MRYWIPCLLFLANSEVISLIALMILFSVFLSDIWKAKVEHDS